MIQSALMMVIAIIQMLFQSPREYKKLITCMIQDIRWGVKCHEIKMWKPPYDLFICDKAINTLEYFKEKKDETI